MVFTCLCICCCWWQNYHLVHIRRMPPWMNRMHSSSTTCFYLGMCCWSTFYLWFGCCESEVEYLIWLCEIRVQRVKWFSIRISVVQWRVLHVCDQWPILCTLALCGERPYAIIQIHVFISLVLSVYRCWACVWVLLRKIPYQRWNCVKIERQRVVPFS